MSEINDSEQGLCLRRTYQWRGGVQQGTKGRAVRPEGPKVGWDFWEGAATGSGLGERCKLLHAVGFGAEPRPPNGFSILKCTGWRLLLHSRGFLH